MGLSIQEKKFKIDFQDGNCGGHLVFPIRAILAIFSLQVTSMILTKFQVDWPIDLKLGKNHRGDFQDGNCGGHLVFPIRAILAIFRFRRRNEYRFSRWPPWSPSWISDRNVFNLFIIFKVTLMLPTKFRVNWPFGSGEEV